jgi:hypothetical protein
MNDVLLSDEDMEMMYLSAHAQRQQQQRQQRQQQRQQQHLQQQLQHQKHKPPQAASGGKGPMAVVSGGRDSREGSDGHEEVEMMFENYLMQLEWADTEIREAQHAIRNTEDTVEIQLDLLRNRILRFELLLNIVTAVVSFGCLVTGTRGGGVCWGCLCVCLNE